MKIEQTGHSQYSPSHLGCLCTGNDARDPSCICICYDDRILARQPIEQLQRDCFRKEMPWVNETQCNCFDGTGPLPAASDASSHFIGRAPVFLPYVGVKLDPMNYPASTLVGHNYHFPAAAECKFGRDLGFEGCTWRRAALTRMLYGADLIRAGWNHTFVKDESDNSAQAGPQGKGFDEKSIQRPSRLDAKR